jgi:hypothetical protein
MQAFPIQKIFVQGPDFIELTPDLLQEQLVFAEANQVDGFVISHDWRKPLYPTLEFLSANTVRGLNITFEAVEDISAINNFHQLEVLYVGYMSYPKQDIYLDKFAKLRVLNINWDKHYKSVDRLTNVIRLDLWKYKPKSRDFRELTNLNKLVYAIFTMPGIDTLDGIENLKSLKELELRNVRSLKRFFSDNRIPTCPIEELRFEACPNFDVDSIPVLPTLKTLCLSQIGKTETLRHVLNRLQNLERLIFTQSELTESNLNYLLDHQTLKKVTIDNKKHYSIKEKEIQKLLDEKNKKLPI